MNRLYQLADINGDRQSVDRSCFPKLFCRHAPIGVFALGIVGNDSSQLGLIPETLPLMNEGVEQIMLWDQIFLVVEVVNSADV